MPILGILAVLIYIYTLAAVFAGKVCFRARVHFNRMKKIAT